MKLFIHALLILLIISTLCICSIKPQMHKTVMVFDSAYTITPQKEIETEKETIPIMEKTVETPKVVKTAEPIIQKEVKQVKKAQPTAVKTTQTARKQEVKKVEPISVQKTEVQKVQPVTVQPKTVKQNTEKQVVTNVVVQKTPETKVLTQQEETIAWNTWRSNLQNKIMQDTKLPILPTGVVFKFSFTVDKYGKISNLQTWSENATYTPYAIQYIAPVIRSYQGRSILNFPEGTARIITEVKGGWRISESEKFSTTQDYNDTEKVIVR